MKRYARYKNSGVEWIGEIPEGWSALKTKYILTERKERSKNGEEDLLSVSEYYGVAKRSEKISHDDILVRAESLIDYKLVYENDLVINIMLAWKKGLGRSIYYGITSPAYCVYYFGENHNSNYFHYLFRTNLYADMFKANSTGIIDSRLRLYSESLYQIISIVPPLSEQIAIANYLDRKTVEIDELILQKKRLLKLYEEKKTTIINQAVTKGIDPNAKLKDSGVNWLGEIPAHWKIRKFKYLFKLVTEKNDLNLPKIGLENIESRTGNYVESESNFDGDGIYFRVNDILFGKLRPYLAKVYLAKFAGKAIGDFFVFRSKNDLIDKFASNLIRSKYFINIADSSTFGSKMPRVSWEFIANLKIAYPSYAEQLVIVSHIENEITRINAKIAKTKKIIALQKEYRAALISEVVTGKIKITEEISL